MRDERAVEIIRCRNMVLAILNMTFPNGMQGAVLFRTLLGVHPEMDNIVMGRDLSYLTSKGLIEKRTLGGVDPRELPWRDAYWVLTALGNELANRIAEDPALEA